MLRCLLKKTTIPNFELPQEGHTTAVNYQQAAAAAAKIH